MKSSPPRNTSHCRLIPDVICLISYFVPNHLSLRLVSKQWDCCIQSMHTSPNGCKRCYAVAEIDCNAHRIIPQRRNRLFFMAQWKLSLPFSCPSPSPSQLTICNQFVNSSPPLPPLPPPEPMGPVSFLKSKLSHFLCSSSSSSAATLPSPPYLIALREVQLTHDFTSPNQISYLIDVITASDLRYFISTISLRKTGLRMPVGAYPDRVIASMTQLRSLKDLSLEFIELTAPQTHSLFTELPLLSSAYFYGCGLNDDHMSFCSSTSLTSLSLLSNPFSPASISNISFPNLKHLTLTCPPYNHRQELRALQSIADSKSTSFLRLESWDLPHATLDEDAVTILSSSSLFPILERIKCPTRMEDDAFLSIICGVAPLARLRSLETCIYGDSIKDMYTSRYKPKMDASNDADAVKLSSLVLTVDDGPLVGDEVATILSSLPSSSHLTELKIDSCSDIGLEAIFNHSSSNIRNLKVFSWSSSYLYEQSDGFLVTQIGIESLCSSPLATNLTHLSINACQSQLVPPENQPEESMDSWRPKTFMTDECAALIASCAHLQKLRSLTLLGNNMSLSKGVLGLLESPHLPHLSELDAGIFPQRDVTRMLTHPQDESVEAVECAQRIADALRKSSRDWKKLRIPNGDYYDAVLHLLVTEFPFFGHARHR